jgi:hypothetical protein
MHVTTIAGIISSWSTLVIPVLIFLLRPQRLVKANWLLVVYALLQFMTDRLQEFFLLSGIEHTINFVFVMLEYSVLAALLYITLQKKRNLRWVLAGSLLFTILSILTFTELGTGYYGSIRGISAILLISYAMFFFLEWITAEIFEPINARAEFWMITGILLYLAGNFFFFITRHQHFAEGLLIHYLVNLLRNACFIAALVQSRTASGKTASLLNQNKF